MLNLQKNVVKDVEKILISKEDDLLYLCRRKGGKDSLLLRSNMKTLVLSVPGLNQEVVQNEGHVYSACSKCWYQRYVTAHLKSSSREATFDQPSTRKYWNCTKVLCTCKSDALNFMYEARKPNKNGVHPSSLTDFTLPTAQNWIIFSGSKWSCPRVFR